MANLVITSSTNTFTVVSNDYIHAIGTPCITLNKSDITKVYLSKDSTHVIIEIYNTKDFVVDLLGYLGGSTNKSVSIDSIDGVAPTTIQHIHDLFVTLKN